MVTRTLLVTKGIATRSKDATSSWADVWIALLRCILETLNARSSRTRLNTVLTQYQHIVWCTGDAKGIFIKNGYPASSVLAPSSKARSP